MLDYAIGEFIYMLLSNMNLQIGKVKNYNNKILISSPSFKIGINLKINLDVKSKEVEKVRTKPNIRPNEKHKQDVKPNIEFDKEHKPITDSNREHKSNIEFDKEHKQDVKMIRTKPDTNRITYEEEKVALILGTTAVFTV